MGGEASAGKSRLRGMSVSTAEGERARGRTNRAGMNARAKGGKCGRGGRVERVESGTRQTCLAITEKLKRSRQPLCFLVAADSFGTPRHAFLVSRFAFLGVGCPVFSLLSPRGKTSTFHPRDSSFSLRARWTRRRYEAKSAVETRPILRERSRLKVLFGAERERGWGWRRENEREERTARGQNARDERGEAKGGRGRAREEWRARATRPHNPAAKSGSV